MTELLYNYINVGNDKQMITIDTINNHKIYLMYKIGQQSLYSIMCWLINEFKYKCDQFNSMNDFRFSQNGQIIETSKDLEISKSILNTNPILKLNLVATPLILNYNPSNVDYSQYILDDTKFESNENSIVLFVKTLVGKTIMINVNPNVTHTYELKLKIQEIEGIPIVQQRIIFGGRQLEDNYLLSDYNFENNASIHLVLRLRGGMYNEVSGRNGQYEPLNNIFFDISYYCGFEYK